MVEFRVPAADSLRRRIRDPQSGFGGAKVREVVAWCFGVSASDLGPTTEVSYLYPHFSVKQ
jgi:hypothetical protein